MPQWIGTTVKITTDKGPKEVPCLVFGRFAIHHKVDRGEDLLFGISVTHIATGRSFDKVFPTVALAKKCAKKLEAQGDAWSFTTFEEFSQNVEQLREMAIQAGAL